MKTKRIKDETDLAASILKNGGLVAVPTETVYGLAGNGLDEKAVQRIYDVKGRPQRKPLSLMVSGAEAMEKYCEDIPPQAYALAREYWPGPLTIVLKAKDIVPEIVRAGGTTVGLRCPASPLTLETLQKAQIPFAAPSANPSGEPSPKTAQKVMEYFSGEIEAVIDGGECSLGIESTLIDLSRTPYRVLREGALSPTTLAESLRKNMLVIGFTGGSGCGKTTALEVIRMRGGLVIDADELYHELLETNVSLVTAIEAAFPGCTENGKVDRKTLGKEVFSHPEKLAKLNEITHPFVADAIVAKLNDYAMNGGTLAAIDAVELISSGLPNLCKKTIGILAPRKARLERIRIRDGISAQDAELRLHAQRPDAYFRENCSYVIENYGTQEEFLAKTNELIKEIEQNE